MAHGAADANLTAAKYPFQGKHMTQQSRNRGFTLIEVMIVVVIIGVLVSIAYPSYQRHMIQTRRSDAQSALLQSRAPGLLRIKPAAISTIFPAGMR